MRNNLVVFIWFNMKVGGIETYIYQETKYLLKKNTTVALVMPENGIIDEAYNDIDDDKGFIRLFELNENELNKYLLKFNIDEIKIITFDFYSFANAEKFRKVIPNIKVHTFIFVPHFLGADIFLEEGFTGRKSICVKDKIKPIIHNIHRNGNIKYFALKHVDTFENHYGIVVENKEKELVPLHNISKKYDANKREDVYNQNKKIIMAASRLDFPHKGFILGLVDAFVELKPKYPELVLKIVGDGTGKDILLDKIDKISDDYIRKDIILEGTVSPEQLIDHYDNAYLSIGVAGCLAVGAKRGVLSLPARHYDNKCEVYGFYPESRELSLSDKPGHAVIPYIEQALRMSKDQYTEICRNTYEKGTTSKDVIERVDFEIIKNCKADKVLTDEEIVYIQKTIDLHKKIYKRKIYIDVIKKEGIVRPVIRKIKKLITK